MKFNQIALAVLAAGAATAASAGVTVTPLIGYNYVQEDAAAEKQRRLFETGRQLNDARDGVNNPENGGVALKSDLYTGLALGVELTPSTQLQVEYGVTNPSARASEDSYSESNNIQEEYPEDKLEEETSGRSEEELKKMAEEAAFGYGE